MALESYLPKSKPLRYALGAALFVLVAAVTASAATQFQNRLLPIRDEEVSEEELKRGHIQVDLYAHGWLTGSGMDMASHFSVDSLDLKVVEGPPQDPEKLLWEDLGSNDGYNACPQFDGHPFPLFATLYYPDGSQTNTIEACWGVSDDHPDRNLRYRFHGHGRGFGDYELRGSVTTGEVNACWEWPKFKCWAYHSQDFDYSFEVKEEGRWFF